MKSFEKFKLVIPSLWPVTFHLAKRMSYQLSTTCCVLTDIKLFLRISGNSGNDPFFMIPPSNSREDGKERKRVGRNREKEGVYAGAEALL